MICRANMDTWQTRKVAGNFSMLNIEFKLTRHVSRFYLSLDTYCYLQTNHYVVDYYIPSSLLVLMSQVSFWLDPTAIPGRVTLGKIPLKSDHKTICPPQLPPAG